MDRIIRMSVAFVVVAALVGACGDDDGTTSAELGTVVVDGVEHVLVDAAACRDPGEDTTAHAFELVHVRATDADGNVVRLRAEMSEFGYSESVSWLGPAGSFAEQREWDVRDVPGMMPDDGWAASTQVHEDRVVGTATAVGFDDTEGSVLVEFDVRIPDVTVDCPWDPFPYVPIEPGF